MSLITTTEFIDSGLPTSDDIRTEEIQMAIDTVELVYLKPFITPELYAAMLDAQYENVALKNNIKFAEYHLVFAYLLYDRFRLTRFSTVLKEDEHSADPGEEDILNICQLHWEDGLQIIISSLLDNEIEPVNEITPQPVFAELAFKYYNKKK